MRFVLAMVLAGLAALPLGASAQPAEEDSLSSWQVDEGAGLEQPAPEKPALELKLDDAGVDVVPSPALLTVDGYTLEEMNVRVKRARIGFLVSSGVCEAGLLLLMVAAAAGLATWEPLGGATNVWRQVYHKRSSSDCRCRCREQWSCRDDYRGWHLGPPWAPAQGTRVERIRLHGTTPSPMGPGTIATRVLSDVGAFEVQP